LKAHPLCDDAQTSFARPDLRQDFLSLYPQRDTHICKLPGQNRWRTWTSPLADHQILGVIADGGRGVLRGCHWGQQTRFAVLDIDTESKYHNAERLAKITTALAAAGLNANLYQSSDSGGWHLYVSFTEWAGSEEVAQTLRRWLKALGYDLKGGQLEVFPSRNALRLPLQPGFGWISPDGILTRTREELTLEEALNTFLFELQLNARSWEAAKERIKNQIDAAGKDAQGRQERLDIEDFDHLFRLGKIEAIWQKGRQWWCDGLQESGERHNAVLAVGHYLWYGDDERGVTALPGGKNDQYRAMLIQAWLKKKHNGKCRHINEGNWRIVQDQIQRAVIWRRNDEPKERLHYPLTDRLLRRLVAMYRRTGKIWSIELFERSNEKRRLEARTRIAEAVCTLEDEGALFISVNEVAQRAHAHWRTVKKNLDLLAYTEDPSITLEEDPNIETETTLVLLANSAGVNNYGGLSYSTPLHPSTMGSGGMKNDAEVFQSMSAKSLLEPSVQDSAWCSEFQKITRAVDDSVAESDDSESFDESDAFGAGINTLTISILESDQKVLYPVVRHEVLSSSGANGSNQPAKTDDPDSLPSCFPRCRDEELQSPLCAVEFQKPPMDSVRSASLTLLPQTSQRCPSNDTNAFPVFCQPMLQSLPLLWRADYQGGGQHRAQQISLLRPLELNWGKARQVASTTCYRPRRYVRQIACSHAATYRLLIDTGDGSLDSVARVFKQRGRNAHRNFARGKAGQA
jgi:hypothetical protein